MNHFVSFKRFVTEKRTHVNKLKYPLRNYLALFKDTISKLLKDVGFSAVEWHKETNGKNVLECPQDSSLEEANKWITAAREDFGICGYFVAYK